jgi:hypothetical protein
VFLWGIGDQGREGRDAVAVTNLTDTDPEVRFLDIRSGFIVAAQEADGEGGLGRFCGIAELGEHG